MSAPALQRRLVQSVLASRCGIATVGAAEQRFSPAAKWIVENMKLNTAGLMGTSKGGLISKADILLALQAGKLFAGGSNLTNVPSSSNGSATIHSERAAPKDHSTKSSEITDFADVPNNNMRKVIAKRLTESKATVPHFYSTMECEIDELLNLRKALKKEMDINVSVNDLVIKAAAMALRDVPEANAKWNKATSTIQGQSSVDISVAVATPNGLITPILKNADTRGLVNIATTVRELATRARDGKLKPEEFQGGTFSISNLGMFGISSFSAVINTPQTCIMAVGSGITRIAPPTDAQRAAYEKAVAAGDAAATLNPRTITTMAVQLSADRRVIDEAIAAQFLQVFRTYLSSPRALLL